MLISISIALECTYRLLEWLFLSPCSWIALLLFLPQSLELSFENTFLAVFEAFLRDLYFEGGFVAFASHLHL